MKKLLAGVAAVALLQADAVAIAQPMGPGASSVRVNIGPDGAASRVVSIPAGKSLVVDLPVDARDVLVSNPKVADVVLRSPRRLSVLGVGPGRTDAVFFDASGRQILSLDVRVGQDVAALAEMVQRLTPGSQVKVESVADSIVLSGMVASSGDADRVVRLAERFAGKPELVLNMLSVAGKEQVMLKVRVVEMQRSVIKQLGVDLSGVINATGASPFIFETESTFGVNGVRLGGGAGQLVNRLDGGRDRLTSTLQAFERVGLVRTLAEPNLTAVSGEPAKFLAGGEFPVPVSVDDKGRVTAEYKPYGVGLGFTPVVLSGGRISLRISTEVSELTSQGAFQLQGLTLSGLNVRRAETTVELPSGGAMMIAGLLQNRSKQTLDAVPGLTSLPVLGALFRSRDFLNEETELVVIVTPYIVSPTRPADQQTPADGFRLAQDLDAILLGRVNQPSAPGAAGSAAPPPAAVGYVIE
ncbi:MAG TPA: type II and III secretion system protein family protein [Caulobacteraceae bacterium]|jgi:pilus assembly protein CpaC